MWSERLKSHWLPVGVFVAFIAFVAGLAYGLPGSDGTDDTRTVEAVEPTPVPTVGMFDIAIPDDVATVTVEVIRDPAAQSAPPSQAYVEFLGSPWGTAIYLDSIDKVIHLPSDARVTGYVTSISCVPGTYCPPTTLTVLERGSAKIRIDSNDNIVTQWASPKDLQAFQFLIDALK